jgi:pimeloyl-ACP methyl ester carboxylesterase
MNDSTGAFEERRTPNGLYCRVTGRGTPLLLLHGLMASGIMFDPLADLLRDDFRLLIPDLRGHGKSGGMEGPYDVATMAGDLDAVLAETGFARANVLGYSHGGAVAQALARARPQVVAKLILVCTYARNVATLREYLEALALVSLLSVISPRTVAGVIVRLGRAAMPGMTAEKTAWMREIIGANDRKKMRAAARSLFTFDSRPWLKSLSVPTLVIAGAEDAGIPAHHFNTLMFGIPGALGTVVQGAGHTLLWTHTEQLAQLISKHAIGSV